MLSGGTSITILDCTMRDGGYYNDWDFSPEFATEYFQTLDSVGVEYVEVGFRYLLSASHRGPWAYSPDSLIERFNISPRLKVGVMVNFGEMKDISPSQLDLLFPSTSHISFVRIACHFEEISIVSDLAGQLKAKGLRVGVNLMQVSERSEAELIEFAQIVNSFQADFAYIADSLGALSITQCRSVCNTLSQHLTVPFGIHAHDNKGLALENTLVALEFGATMLDCTMGGMGRGAGNTATEHLLAELEEANSLELPEESMSKLHYFVESNINPLREKYRWGPSFPYRLSANWGIHPSFTQELIEDNSDVKHVITALESLRYKNAKRFTRDLIPTSSSGVVSASSRIRLTPSFKSRVGKGVLLVGGGLSAETHHSQICEFAAKNDLTVLALNRAWEGFNNPSSLFRLASSQLGFELDSSDFWELDGEKIVNQNVPETYSDGVNFSCVPVQMSLGKLMFRGELAIIPNNLTLSFGLACALALGASTIYLAGVDGYRVEDERNILVQWSLAALRENNPGVALASLTPSRFAIPFQSPYWRGNSE